MGYRKLHHDDSCVTPLPQLPKNVRAVLEQAVSTEKVKAQLYRRYRAYTTDSTLSQHYSPTLKRYILDSDDVVILLLLQLVLGNELCAVPTLKGGMINMNTADARAVLAELCARRTRLAEELAEVFACAERAESPEELHALTYEVES